MAHGFRASRSFLGFLTPPLSFLIVPIFGTEDSAVGFALFEPRFVVEI